MKGALQIAEAQGGEGAAQPIIHKEEKVVGFTNPSKGWSKKMLHENVMERYFKVVDEIKARNLPTSGYVVVLDTNVAPVIIDPDLCKNFTKTYLHKYFHEIKASYYLEKSHILEDSECASAYVNLTTEQSLYKDLDYDLFILYDVAIEKGIKVFS